MKNKLIVLSGLAMSLLPVVSFAQSTNTGNCATGSLFGILCTIGKLLNTIIPILITLGVVYFVWGVITYVISSDEEAKKAGRDRIIFGIIGLAVIVGMWGLVNILSSTFGVSSSNSGSVPNPVPTFNP